MALLAERCQDLEKAETALTQIKTSVEVLVDGGHAVNANFYAAYIPKATAICAQLRNH
jgi:hypothetical protein